MFYTSKYQICLNTCISHLWNKILLSSCTLLQRIEASRGHVSQFTESKLLYYTYFTSVYLIFFLENVPQYTVMKLYFFWLNAIYLIVLSFLSTCFSIHCIEAFWLHVPHLHLLRLLKKKYTSFPVLKLL